MVTIGATPESSTAVGTAVSTNIGRGVSASNAREIASVGHPEITGAVTSTSEEKV